MTKSALYISLLLLVSPITHSATPIDGLYSSLFAGYAYIPPNNVSVFNNGYYYSDTGYRPGYEAGGSFGYKSNPLHYEGEVTYFNANMKHFSQNNQRQTDIHAYNNGILGIANVFYDFPSLIDNVSPYLGIGIGYAWVNFKMDNLSTTDLQSNTRITSTLFAYEGSAGLTLNFVENYALAAGYRYVGTPNNSNVGRNFQINMANVSVIYRYDSARYK
jgi:opacity protein-like surface antigen